MAQKAKVLKYIDRIAQSPEEAQREENQFKVEQNELQLKNDLLGIRREIANEKKQLDLLMKADELDSSAILNQQDTVIQKEADFKALEILIKDLF